MKHPDVLVVGGGLVGLCTAIFLQRTGRRVAIADPRKSGSGASGHNAGIFSLGNCLPTATPGVLREIPRMLIDPLSPLAIRWSYLPRLSPWLARFVLASRPARVESASTAIKTLLDSAVPAYDRLLAPTDASKLLNDGGHIWTYSTDETFRRSQADIALRQRRGIRLKVLTNDGLAELDPALTGRFHAGLHIEDAPFVHEPQELVQRLEDEFLSNDGVIYRERVLDFRVDGAEVHTAITSHGPRRAGSFVVSAGAWSRELVRKLGSDVPLDTERGYGVVLPDPGVELKRPLISVDYHLALTPTRTGLRIVGTDELAGLRAPANFKQADRLIEAVQVMFPELKTAGAERWMNFRPSLPDSLPVIGRATRQSNVYLAFGHGHIGLTVAAVTGQIIQELMDHDEPSVDITPFRPTRFSHRPRRKATGAA